MADGDVSEVKYLPAPDGRRYLVPHDEPPAELAFLWNEIYGELAIYDHADCAIAEGDVVLDLGANFGLFALHAIDDYRAGLVVCVEADPLNAACLLDNLERHGHADRIAIINRAVYEHGDGVRFTRVPRSPCCNFVSAIYPERADPAHEDLVPSITIDQLVAQLELDRVDFIKSDTEGSEVAALRGAAETITRWKPKLIFTIYHRPDHPREIEALVRGYRPDYHTRVVDKGPSDKVLLCW